MWRRRRNTSSDVVIGLLAAIGVGAITCAIYKCIKSKGHYAQCHYESEQIKIVDSAEYALLNKIGVTHSELEEAKLLNRTAYDLAKDKGFSEEQLKMFINQERYIAIDELVLNRKISREVGEQVKDKIREHTDKWDGKLC